MCVLLLLLFLLFFFILNMVLVLADLKEQEVAKHHIYTYAIIWFGLQIYLLDACRGTVALLKPLFLDLFIYFILFILIIYCVH